ncbi:MAG: septum formation protein Maf [Flavobacteriales bacterium]|nr:septum formation protein Maf [Flavobacteriales bacterium]
MLSNNNADKKKIILASGSPRRQQFFKDLNLDFEIRLKEIEESYPSNLKREEIAIYISEKKAKAFDNIHEDEIIVTSDTVVWIEDEALGKPSNRDEAFSMLVKLSGKSHEVITAFTLKTKNATISNFGITKVYFKTLTEEEIGYYIDHYKPYDKAGAYGIQEWIGLIGINKIEGSYFNVVGLPVDKLYNNLLKLL